MDEELQQKVRRETARRIDRLTATPGAILKYDLNGDGQIDEREWEILRSTIEARVVREFSDEPTIDEELPQEETDEWVAPAATDEWTPEDEIDPHIDLPVLEVIDERYEVLKELGQGMQGQTLLARRREDDSYVALKELSFTSLDSWKSLELFDREAKTLRQLDHPSIPQFVDSFHVELEGSPSRFFIAQEFVSGDNLAVLLARGTRWVEEDLHRLCEDLLDVLAYLHSTSPPIIHRDLKPSNIIRRPDGSYALVDFGGVQIVLPDEVGGSTVVGTSGYMPPEQLTGHAVPQSDLYGLGTTLIHLVTGVHPSKLPRSRLRLDWKDRAVLDDRWADFIECLAEPVVEDRHDSAGAARAALPSSEPAADAPGSDLIPVSSEERLARLGYIKGERKAPGGDARLTVRADALEIDTSPNFFRKLIRRDSGMVVAYIGGFGMAILVLVMLAIGPGLALFTLLGIGMFLMLAADQAKESVTLRRDGRYELIRTKGQSTTKESGRMLDVRQSMGRVEIVSDVERTRFAEACRPETRRWLVEQMKAFVEQ